MKLNLRFFPFNFIGDLLRFLRRSFRLLRDNVLSSIRLQLIFTFIVCSVAAVIVFSLTSMSLSRQQEYPQIDYSRGMRDIEEHAKYMVNYLKSPVVNEQEALSFLNREMQRSEYKILVLTTDGKVLYKTADAPETQVDIYNLFANTVSDRITYDSSTDVVNTRREFVSFYPVDLKSQKAYLVVSGMPTPEITYTYSVTSGVGPVSLLTSVAAFVLLFYWMTKRKMKHVESLADGLLEISKGNLEYRIAASGKDELGQLGENINYMAAELNRTIEEERRAERTKNELITNVSHDLRTPLTLIIGYLRLLKDKNYEDEKQADSYVNIAFSKSEKLKRLIDDLFEYTKLSNHGNRLVTERVSLNELLEQLLEEHVGHAEENQLRLLRDLPAERLLVQIDTDKIIRVFDNLLSNAIKYSEKPGLITVTMTKEPGWVKVCVGNRGRPIPKEELERLFERFYRVDASRTSESGGSGLGLAIAKSIVESHGGEIWGESEADEVRFCVRLRLDGDEGVPPSGGYGRIGV
ncbi:two-component sensor histidine kinase [Paenibacillus sp. J31TS4]|uniref:sensor histidine kinase n=1 Tax=Paenibacillus sp. J31TS4 TaxID=2807195 RepID=UPI001B29897F|nr:ATP-binding protein [Paenibacillus sp. J31TS4]GIP41282.1 two-component sensor histidine kinase [Paenibacillus sp. J31TS4]